VPKNGELHGGSDPLWEWEVLGIFVSIIGLHWILQFYDFSCGVEMLFNFTAFPFV